ncbi:MAG: hypothetical protein CME61_04195 [Halobacteriovoraceae bacterium]|nr:hypothetical protein [Halobacteriovoraceae bacterium]|tara:strand:- start:301 stop:732 length:432 start_codon:yes stop_codon:yes gene_type:complete
MRYILLALILALPAISLGAKKIKIKNALDMRDPFKRPVTKLGSKKQSISKYYRNGVYTNQNTIDGVPLDKIKVVGVMLGKNRRALAKVEGLKENFIVQEGQVLGLNGAEVKGILPGGIVLVEKIKNVYDEFEYLETLIPIETE